MLDQGANPIVCDRNGNAPLHLADDLQVILFLLDKGADTELLDHYGETPLCGATRQEMWDKARILLDRGANPDVSGKHGRAPLHSADDLQFIQLLLDRRITILIRIWSTCWYRHRRDKKGESLKSNNCYWVWYRPPPG